MPGVLHVISTTDHRGAEVFASHLAAALEHHGHPGRIVALAPGTSSAQLPVPTLGVRRLGVGSLFALRALARRATVVVAHGSTTLPAVALATTALSVPFVYRAIGDPAFWSNRVDRRLRVGVALRRAAAVVALWDAAAADLTRRHGLRPARVHVVPNGVPGAPFLSLTADGRAAARRALGLPEQGRLLAYLGALAPEKDVRAALRAVGAIPDVRLVIAGDGPEASSLRTEAATLAPDRVRFLGAIDDVVPVLAAADALVLPSRTEGIPAAAIEAGLAGLPVVATAVGGLAEVVIDGETGALVEPGDVEGLTSAIATVLEGAERLGAAARRHCQTRFELDAVAAAWARVLDVVVAHGAV